MSNGDSNASGFACGFWPVSSPSLTIAVPLLIGSIYYVIKSAQKGIIEAIVIKKYKIVNSCRTLGVPSIMYVDTLNGLWSAEDLCSQAQAIAYAIAYYENLITEACTNQ